MKSVLWLTLSVCAVLPLQAQLVRGERPQKGIFQLNGKVKSVKETGYIIEIKNGDTTERKGRQSLADCDFLVKFNAETQKTEHLFYVPSGKVKDHYKFKYDAAGNMVNEFVTKRFWKWKNTTCDSGTYYRSVNYFYDAAGKLQKSEAQTSDTITDKPKHFYTEIYTYDSAGRKTGLKSSTEERVINRSEYKYDKAGNLAEEKKYQFDSSLTDVNTYSYDKDQNCTEVKEAMHNGFLRSRGIFKYSGTKYATEESWYYNEEPLDCRNVYKRDEHNNIVETRHYESEDTLHSITVNRYEYDKYGNWTKNTILINGKPKFVLYRTIEYYFE
ncbi:MAG: RHS repeat protein [Bacteroidetes bacterium]|nr:MAG: RHS repeat protein [Bacteroidota bacterium]